MFKMFNYFFKSICDHTGSGVGPFGIGALFLVHVIQKVSVAIVYI